MAYTMDPYNCLDMCNHNKQEYISQGFGLGLNVVLVIYFLSYMFGWCTDPFHENLRKKVVHLENENDSLLGQIDSLQDEVVELTDRVKEYDEFVPGAKHVFELRKKLPTLDTQG